MWWIVGGIALLILAGAKSGMAFTIKPGVFGTLQDVMMPALDAVQRVWAAHGLRPTITSIEDGQHQVDSKHYQGLAFDIRFNDITPELHNRLTTEVAQLAGSAYDVIHESHGTDNDHLHIEFDPR